MNPRHFTILGFIILGIMSRFFPHPPNFTAVNAIALFGAATLGSLSLSLSVVFATLFLSDLVLGLHSSMIYVYVSFGLVTIIGHFFKSERSLIRTPILLTLSSLLFFVVVNFGVWLSNPMYPKTFAGLMSCYIAAIPFIENQFLGDWTYGAVLFGGYALVNARYLEKRYA